MMHMWVWLGYDVGDLLFRGLHIASKGAFAGACVVLFLIAFLFEGSKVIVARTQRTAARRLYPHKRSDERHNLLWENAAGTREAGPSQHAPHGHPTVSAKYRLLINLHQTVLYLLHNTVGYLLMLVVMIYNLYLVLAVVLGMVLGYFVFGPMLTQLQMECFVKESPYCTPECDENAEGTTPPLLNTSLSSESDFFICQTRSCTPGAAVRRERDEGEPARPRTDTKNCYFGAKRCPSKVAVAKRFFGQSGSGHCHRDIESDKDAESQNVEDSKLLLSEKPSCCKSTPPEPVILEPIVRIVNEEPCCSAQKQKASGSLEEDAVIQGSPGESEKGDGSAQQGTTDYGHDSREESPKISCCHNTKTSSESQEHIA